MGGDGVKAAIISQQTGQGKVMKTEYIDIVGKWGIVVYYDIRPFDEYDIRSDMMAFGVNGQTIEKAVNLLLYEKNKGYSVSSFNRKMTLVFIGKATGEDQWWDTLGHELLDHCQKAIVDYYDVPYVSEDSAWLTGYLMRKVVQQIAVPCK